MPAGLIVLDRLDRRGGRGSIFSAQSRRLIPCARQDGTPLERAIADYDIALTFDPANAEAYCNRGTVRREKGDLTGAIADYTEAIAINPRLADPYNNRGCIRFLQGNLDEALADLQAAIRLAPRLATAYLNRGLVRQDKRDLEGALADFNHAIALEPHLTEAYNGRGLIRAEKGELAKRSPISAGPSSLTHNITGPMPIVAERLRHGQGAELQKTSTNAAGSIQICSFCSRNESRK